MRRKHLGVLLKLLGRDVWEPAILPVSPMLEVSYPALPICSHLSPWLFPTLMVLFSLLASAGLSSPAFSTWASLTSQTSLSILLFLGCFFQSQPLPTPVPLCPALFDQLILLLNLSPSHQIKFLLFQAREMADLFTVQPVSQNNITQAKEYAFLQLPLPFSHQPILQNSQTVF